MKRYKKYYIFVVLVLMLTVSANDMVFAAESSVFCENTEVICMGETSNSTVTPRLMYDRTFTAKYTTGNNVLKVTAYATVRDETANSSGFYITGFKSITVTKVSGWQNVSDGEIKSITYANNHQQAVVKFTFKGIKEPEYFKINHAKTLDNHITISNYTNNKKNLSL